MGAVYRYPLGLADYIAYIVGSQASGYTNLVKFRGPRKRPGAFSYSNIDAVIGTTETAASTTAGHEIPWTRMTSEAVKARTPPMVRFALHRFRSPLVLNASVMSNPVRS